MGGTFRPGFFLREAIRSIRSNAAISVAATVTVMIAVFILGAVIPSFLYVQSTVDKQKDRLDMNVFISDSATNAQVQGLSDRLAQLKSDGLVESYTYISKDDALKELKGRLNNPDIIELLPSNPLPASYKVKPRDPADNPDIEAALRDSPALDDLDGGISYAKETSERLLKILKVIQIAGVALIGVLLVAAVLLIGNTIRLSIFARRREVEVMRLVGATNWFIRWPFIIEGIICGIVGAAAAIGLIWVAKIAVVDDFVANNTGSLTSDQATTIGFVWLGLILVAAGGLVGALGSGITLRRFLKV